MIARSMCYLLLFYVLVTHGMDNEEGQFAVAPNTYNTFTPRNSGGQNDISSVPSLRHSGNVPYNSIDLSLDLNDDPQEVIADLNDDEVSFLVKACKFTKLKDVTKKRAKAVIKENAHHPKIQKIISTMRQKQVSPDEIHIDHDQEVVRSGGVELGVDVKDIHKISYDLAGLMWKEDHNCCGRTISQKTGQKIIANGLTVLTVCSLMACNLFLVISNYDHSCETINNYYNYNYTS
jgi:hypothetical protein